MLLLDYVEGLQYTIELDKKYEFYEIIPLLENTFKKRFALRNLKFMNVSQLIVISIDQTHDRYINSQFYFNQQKAQNEYYDEINCSLRKNKTEEENENEFNQLFYPPPLKDCPIILTPDEQQLIKNIKEFLGPKLTNDYWLISSHC